MTTAGAAWRVWSCDASIVVTDPAALAEARDVVEGVLQEVDDAASRFRADSEVVARRDDFTAGAVVSPMLARLVHAALDAASWTDGDVDPTLGRLLTDLGYDRDISGLEGTGESGSAGPGVEPVTVSVHEGRPRWQDVRLDGRMLTVPDGVELDLGATAKAVAADLAADLVASRLGVGALVSLGGDLATAGPAPDESWQILVRDLDDDPEQQVTLAAGSAMATSSTQKRRWRSGGRALHHILDPRLGLPAEPVWRSVTVASSSCLHANALSTAAIVRGHAATAWLEAAGASARLVDADGRVVRTAGWPDPDAETVSTTKETSR